MCLPVHDTVKKTFLQDNVKTDFFTIRGGLPNAFRVFTQTGRGRVAFMGGSITAMEGWRTLVCADLERRFPRTQFEFINAGIPSTDSVAGAFRLSRDAFKNGPVDLLFEEAAVNDAVNSRTDKEQIRGMEGIIRQARNLNPFIDIIVMYFADPDNVADYHANTIPRVIQNHEAVASHYTIPSINQAQEVAERLYRGEFSWENDFKDLHPAPFGHALYSASIKRLFDAAWPGFESTPTPVTAYSQPPQLDDYSYTYGDLIPVVKAAHRHGFVYERQWKNNVGGNTRPGFVDVPMLVGMKPGDHFELLFYGTAMGLLVAAGPDAGAMGYKIDDDPWKELDLFTPWSSDLHLPWLYLLDDELLIDTKHVLTLRISSDKNPASKGHACRIVNFALNNKPRIP